MIFPEITKNQPLLHRLCVATPYITSLCRGHEIYEVKQRLAMLVLGWVTAWCKICRFFLRGDFTPFMRTSFQIWHNLFSLLFPNDFKNLNSLDIGFREMGAKRRLNGVNKWKKSVKNFFAAAMLQPFWDHFFPLLFHKSKQFAHWTLGNGGKRM